jgi:hypothetical protein
MDDILLALIFSNNKEIHRLTKEILDAMSELGKLNLGDDYSANIEAIRGFCADIMAVSPMDESD